MNIPVVQILLKKYQFICFRFEFIATLGTEKTTVLNDYEHLNIFTDIFCKIDIGLILHSLSSKNKRNKFKQTYKVESCKHIQNETSCF